MGQYEALYVSIFYGTAGVLTFVAFAGASKYWEMIETREVEVKEGFLGKAVSYTDCIKFLAMGSAILISTFYASWSIGDTVDQLIGWFDKWSDDERFEAGTDISGTSLVNDLQYHALHVIYSWIVFNFIIFGGHFIADNYLGFKELEDCDLDGVDESYYSDVRSLIAT